MSDKKNPPVDPKVEPPVDPFAELRAEAEKAGAINVMVVPAPAGTAASPALRVDH